VLKGHDRAIVLRTDVSSEPESAVLLPTSVPSRDIAELAGFVRDALDSIVNGGIAPHRAAVLASPLVPPVVSALAMLDDSGRSVEIDSVWGFPDGLLNLAHDSSIVDGGKVHMRRRRKPACLLLQPAEAELDAPLGAPWDWGWTLRQDEALTIASWTRRVSSAAGQRVQLMILARVDGQRGPGGLLPFHFLVQPRPRSGLGISPPYGRSMIVRRPSDLRSGALGDLIAFRPDREVARDRHFLEAVAEFAVARDLPISFSGSRLGHARYILEHHGATVYLTDETPAETLTVPAIARARTGLLRLVHLSQEAAMVALRTDLGDEASGLSLPQMVALHSRRRPQTTFPGAVWLSETTSHGLNAAGDRPGQVVGFGE
jgi:hypothetical protein